MEWTGVSGQTPVRNVIFIQESTQASCQPPLPLKLPPTNTFPPPHMHTPHMQPGGTIPQKEKENVKEEVPTNRPMI